MEKLKVLDLFSGIGGFSLGLERTGGFETIGFCEIEKYPQRVLRKHWPDVPIYNDVRELDGSIDADVITGGYPCQPFSTAGKRRGEEDDRHLWPEMLRLIKAIRPRWVIAENVAGHISMGLDTVLSDLEAEAYTWWTFVIPACAVDAKHRRDRLWIIANLRSETGAADTDADRSRFHREGKLELGETELRDEQKCEPRSMGEDVEKPERKRVGNKPGTPGGQGRQPLDTGTESLRQGYGQSVPSGKCADSEVLGDSESERLGEARRPRARPKARAAGTSTTPSDVANTEQHGSRREKLSEEANREEADRPTSGSSGCSDSNTETPTHADSDNGLGRRGDVQMGRLRIQGETEANASAKRCEWAAEPDVGRVVDGVPNRVDRLKGLGNAVVPQIPEMIGYAILEAHSLR